MQLETLPGFREFYPRACSRRNHIFGCWRSTAHAFNFLEYDAPVLEPLGLYIEKSGEEIVDQLFNFEDRGGRAVALRPEMTPSLARMIGAKANSLKRPMKWFNIGEHYRYERPQKGRLRAFYQLNVDIIGEQGSAADAELITLLCQSLQSFGLNENDFKVRLSDRDLWLLILAAEGLNDEVSATVLGIIDKMERTDRKKTIEKLTLILGDQAEDFLCRIEGVIAIDDFDKLRMHIENLPLKGDLVVQVQARIEDWSQLLRNLTASGAGDFIQIDLGIVRGLAYYDGFVFEAFEVSGEGRAIAGGGRYDALIKKLGGPDMPAVGFAMGDVTLVDLLESKSLVPDYILNPEFIAIIGGEDERAVALADAAQLRTIGYRIEYPFKSQGFAKQFKSASQSGARFALIYGSEELERGIVKVRDLSKGSELEIPRDQLLMQVPTLLEGGIK